MGFRDSLKILWGPKQLPRAFPCKLGQNPGHGGLCRAGTIFGACPIMGKKYKSEEHAA